MPYRMVYQVFKVIAMAMVLVFVVDIAFYLFRVFSLNQRMESIGVSLQKVVTENNYLPEGQYNMYREIYNDMGESFNKVPDGQSGADAVTLNEFIVLNADGDAVTLNYDQPAESVKEIKGTKINAETGRPDPEVNLVKAQLNRPADYGDIMCIQASVRVTQPIWGFVSGARYSADKWQKGNRHNVSEFDNYEAGYDGTTTFTYTYYVPCLKYQSVTN